MVDSALIGLLGVRKLQAEQKSQAPAQRIECQVRTWTKGPKHHFFGYYGICPWNKSGKYLVCLESDFQVNIAYVKGL